MTSHYHDIRKTKKAQDGEMVKAYGAKTWGFNYANDGYRNVVDYSFLRKWLNSKIGKKWDDVWSEANKKWDHRTYIGKTALDYIWVSPHERRWSMYYIEDGILRFRPRVKYERPKPKVKLVTIDGTSYYRHENIWYEVKTSTIEKDKYSYYSVNDVFLGRMSSRYAWDIGRKLIAVYGKPVYCLAKRQVGKCTCKKLNKLLGD